MVKRRRNPRKSPKRKAPAKRTSRRSGNTSIKERFLTTAIWALVLINLSLIISLVSNFFASPNERPVSMQPKPTDLKNEIITVEVLNACGVQGLANDITQFLRNNNFDVVNVGNYPGGFDLEQTFIFDRVSLNGIYAQKVGKVLGVDEKQIAPQLDESLQLKVTVIIGKDYNKLKVYEKIR